MNQLAEQLAVRGNPAICAERRFAQRRCTRRINILEPRSLRCADEEAQSSPHADWAEDRLAPIHLRTRSERNSECTNGQTSSTLASREQPDPLRAREVERGVGHEDPGAVEAAVFESHLVLR